MYAGYYLPGYLLYILMEEVRGSAGDLKGESLSLRREMGSLPTLWSYPETI